MKNDSSDEKLKQLLSLKKHELPPPGFHDHLNTQILEQIEAERSRSGFRTWLKSWLPEWEFTPASMGMAGATACVLLLFVLTPNQDTPSTPASPSITEVSQSGESPLADSPLLVDSPLMATNSTPTSSPNFLFDTPSLQTERVGFKEDE
ncbi:hypothetical protein N9B94_01845 [Verrucomicrobia bacterium]|nr:hypothetical protein [Verrucomicrobiota bacterium]